MMHNFLNLWSKWSVQNAKVVGTYSLWYQKTLTVVSEPASAYASIGFCIHWYWVCDHTVLA